MSTVPKTRLTEAEYLARERRAEYKSEFFQGEMFAMAGGSREHNRIARNIVSESHQALKGGTCEAFGSDMRVKVSRTGLYPYPDVVIVCGPPQFEDDQLDTLLNPTVLMEVLLEVLSEATERYDRGAKAAQYRRIDSLQEHVLVLQTEPRVERFIRQPDNSWLLREVTDLEGTLELESVGIAIPLREVYRGVEFPPADDGAAE